MSCVFLCCLLCFCFFPFEPILFRSAVVFIHFGIVYRFCIFVRLHGIVYLIYGGVYPLFENWILVLPHPNFLRAVKVRENVKI